MALPPATDLHVALSEDLAGLALLSAHGSSARVSSFDTPQGPVVCVDDRKIHSGRDPVKEARRFVRELDLGPVTVVVLVGFGSGYVARAIAERSSAIIYAFEPDLDALREGLGHGPLPKTLRIITTARRLSQVLYARLQSQDKGLIVRWPPSIRSEPHVYEDGLARAIEAVDRANVRHRTARLRGKGWLRHYLANLPGFVGGPGLPALRGGLKGVPAIIVAAGPSLDRNVHLLRDLQDGAFIMTVNTAAGALARAGVTPHALVSIESLDVTPQLNALPYLREIPAFLELSGNPALWDLPFSRKLPISVDTSLCAMFSSMVDPAHRLSAGFCVANTAVAIAYTLGCNPIILVGSDLAYTDDKVYAQGTLFEDMRITAREGERVAFEGLDNKRLIDERSQDAACGNKTPDQTNTVRAPAWDGAGTVRSARDFLMFRDWYSHTADTLRAEGFELVNATEGGLFIPGWTHRQLADTITAHDLTQNRSVRRQFDALVQQPGHPPRQLHDVVEGELERVRTLLALIAKAHAIVGHDPDGDLKLELAGATELTEINTRVKTLLNGAPLAGEAVFPSIDAVHARGDITTFSFYEAMREPLVELESELARLLQRIENEFRRAS